MQGMEKVAAMELNHPTRVRSALGTECSGQSPEPQFALAKLPRGKVVTVKQKGTWAQKPVAFTQHLLPPLAHWVTRHGGLLSPPQQPPASGGG